MPSCSAAFLAASGLPDSCRPRATRCWRWPLCQVNAALINSSKAAAMARPGQPSRADSAAPRRGRVPHPGHQLPRARPGRDGQGGRGVAQVVEAESVQANRSGAGRHTRRLKLLRRGSPPSEGEHQPIRARLAVGAQMLCQGGGRTAGRVTVRRPASVFGGPHVKCPSISVACSATVIRLWSRSIRLTRRPTSSPQRTPA